MPERLLDRHAAQLLRRLAEEGTAGRGEDQLFEHLFVGHALQALKDRRVLAVHRQEPDVVHPDRICHQIAACHKRFLVGEGDILFCLRGCDRRLQTDHAHNGIEHQVRLRQLCRLNQTVHSAAHLGGGVGNGNLQLLCLFFVKDDRQRGLIFAHLLLEQRDIVCRCERRHL